MWLSRKLEKCGSLVDSLKWVCRQICGILTFPASYGRKLIAQMVHQPEKVQQLYHSLERCGSMEGLMRRTRATSCGFWIWTPTQLRTLPAGGRWSRVLLPVAASTMWRCWILRGACGFTTVSCGTMPLGHRHPARVQKQQAQPRKAQL